MEPIIDPKLFYLCDVCETLDVVMSVLVFAGIVSLIAHAIIYYDSTFYNDGVFDGDIKKFKRGLYITVIAMIISLLGVIFIPSKKTIYQMIVFDNITENNIEAGKDNIKELIDYTIDKIDEVNKED